MQEEKERRQALITRSEYHRMLFLLFTSLVSGMVILAILLVLYKPVIKGNGSSGLYHIPGCPSYETTVIGNDSGDQWFRTEEEAREAGFTLASSCD